jgi:hypothetical protein
LFHKVLDNPVAFGFDDASSIGTEKSIWYDEFHPGSAFYKVLAQDFSSFLSSLKLD